MKFKEKYTTATLNELNKTKITEEAYLQAELTEELIAVINYAARRMK